MIYHWLWWAGLIIFVSVLVTGVWALIGISGEVVKSKEVEKRRTRILEHLRGPVSLIIKDESLTTDDKIRELTVVIDEACQLLRSEL